MSWLQQLATHIRASLLAGASRVEVQEVIFQASVYAGMPATLVALQEMRGIYAEFDGAS